MLTTEHIVGLACMCVFFMGMLVGIIATVAGTHRGHDGDC